jgi:hypothetical protein
MKKRQKEKIKKEIYRIAQTHDKPEWDGYEALPITKSATDSAIAFLEQVVIDMPGPDVTPCPSGYFSFDWQSRPNYWISIVVEEKKLIFAAVFPGGEAHGEMVWSARTKQ